MQTKPEIPSVNAHVKEYLNYYCNLTNPPGFAVLLKGAWGSGKTYFIEQYQKGLDAKNIRALHISLYGMKSTTDIEDKFFQLLYPMRSSRGMAITGIIIKGLLKGALKIDLTGDGKDDGTWNIQIPNIDLPKKLDNIDKSILIFDDLERCKIDLGSLLGYINFFVEHNEMKVILIANEERLLDNADYPSVKEKLIGKTLDISPAFEDALTSLINKIEDVIIKKFLTNNLDIIQNLYQKTDYKNLRSLNQILIEFSRIFQKLPEQVQNHPEALTCILKALTAFSIEIQQGKIFPRDIDQIATKYASFLSNKLFDSTGEADLNESVNNKSHLHKIIEIYPFLDMHEVFPSLAWWKSFFDQGIVDLEELRSSILSSKYFQDENTPKWMKLWHFSELSDEVFERLITEIEEEHQNRVSDELGAITHVVGLFLMFSDAGIYKKSKKDILGASISYIDDLRKSGRLEPWPLYIPLREGIDSMLGGYHSLAFQGKEIEEFKVFLNYLRDARKEVYIEGMTQKAQDLLEVMRDDIFRFYRIICFDTFSDEEGELRYNETPILNYIDPKLFIKEILFIKNEDTQYLFSALSERYKYDSINEKLVEELEWLKSIQSLLLDEASLRQGKLSGYCLTLLNQNYLTKSIERLSSKKSVSQE